MEEGFVYIVVFVVGWGLSVDSNSLYNEWAHLEEIQDFSQRYQTLKDIFISPNYKNEFYHFDPSDDVLDLFAEKVASKIMKKLEKGS